MTAPSRKLPSGRLRTGGSSGAYIVGIKELQKELRAITTDDAKWNRELGRTFRPIAKRAEADARSVASGMGGPQGHFEREGAIKGRATATEIRLTVSDERAYAAFWGIKQTHTGWNEGNSGQPNQHFGWVGNSWDVGGRGGPYALNESIRNNIDSYMDDMWEGIDRIVADAFPDGRI